MKSGMDQLRNAVSSLNWCKESFLNQFTAEELLQIYKMWTASAWDFSPEEWELKQIEDALNGIPPNWDIKTEKPVYYGY
jgi:hypothetical protein